MTLKQLEAFYWAACSPSFASAAERVHISLSSLSKRLVELEDSLGVQLFDRKLHKATLTDAGRLLLTRVRPFLDEADTLRRLVAEGREMHGVCRFGVGELSALTWLPKFISHSKQVHPHLLLEPLVEGGSSSGSLEQRVIDAQLDFAVIAGRSMRSEVSCETVGEVSFCWVASPSLLGRSRTLSSQMLADHAVITLSDGTGTARILEQWLTTNNWSLGQRLTCNSWAAVAGLLSEGLGIGFVPSRWAELLSRSGEVVVLRSEHALENLRYCFYRRTDDRRMLLEHMLVAVKKCVDFRVTGRRVAGQSSIQK